MGSFLGMGRLFLHRENSSGHFRKKEGNAGNFVLPFGKFFLLKRRKCRKRALKNPSSSFPPFSESLAAAMGLFSRGEGKVEATKNASDFRRRRL